MVDRRVFIVFLAVGLLVSVLHAERARNDDLQDEEEDFMNDDTDSNEDDVIETIKRFLSLKKKTTTTTEKPGTGAISALFTSTPAGRSLPTSTKSSSTTSRYGGITSTSRFDRKGSTASSTKDACGTVNPCKNGGTCKTLSSGRFYCFCGQDYYGKNCENKFMSTGAANNDRSRKDHCLSAPCKNNGECVGLRTTYYCRCKLPFYGTSCDKRLSKREEIIEESNSSEQELNAYERDLEDDRDDLRRALTSEDME